MLWAAKKSVAMDEKPGQALRRGKGSSMWNTIASVKSGDARVAISAGNTGALMAMSKLQLRMKEGGMSAPKKKKVRPQLKRRTNAFRNWTLA